MAFVTLQQGCVEFCHVGRFPGLIKKQVVTHFTLVPENGWMVFEKMSSHSNGGTVHIHITYSADCHSLRCLSKLLGRLGILAKLSVIDFFLDGIKVANTA